MKISYECDELIEELKQDILEFGEDLMLFAFYEKVNGITFLTNYDFIEEDGTPHLEEYEKGTVAEIMKASEILKILEEQNRII